MALTAARQHPPAEIDHPALLETLQERMERIARGDAPNTGRFCGYCYARLNSDDQQCKVCQTDAGAVVPAERVPDEVLLTYLAHRRKMMLWVNLFAFAGIFIAVVLAGLIVAFFPSATKLLAVPVMLGGAWYFANLLGGGLGGYLGQRSGRTARARRWQSFLDGRQGDAGRASSSDGR